MHHERLTEMTVYRHWEFTYYVSPVFVIWYSSYQR